jgi:uncharacterized protein YdiU (UPF0061 family)
MFSVLEDAYYKPEQCDAKYRQTLASWLRRYTQRARADHENADIRRMRMNAVNPLYVLRNSLAQIAIEAAEIGDVGPLHELQEVLRQPYTEQSGKAHLAQKRPEWARNRPGSSMLSCSS